MKKGGLAVALFCLVSSVHAEEIKEAHLLRCRGRSASAFFGFSLVGFSVALAFEAFSGLSEAASTSAGSAFFLVGFFALATGSSVSPPRPFRRRLRSWSAWRSAHDAGLRVSGCSGCTGLLLLAFDQFGVFEDREMLGDRGLGHVEAGGDFASGQGRLRGCTSIIRRGSEASA